MRLLRGVGFLAGVCILSGLYAVPARAGESAPGPCGGLTAAEAAAIMHVPRTYVQGPLTTRDISCSYRDTANIFKGVSFNLTVQESAAAASQAMDHERDNLTVDDSVVAVKNLGDEAWRLSGQYLIPRMLVRAGNVWLEILKPEDEATQLRIARLVLKHLAGG